MVLKTIMPIIEKAFEGSDSLKVADTGALRLPIPFTSRPLPFQAEYTPAQTPVDILDLLEKTQGKCPYTRAFAVEYAEAYYEAFAKLIDTRRDIFITDRTKKELKNQTRKAKEQLLAEDSPHNRTKVEIFGLIEKLVNGMPEDHVRYCPRESRLISTLKDYMSSQREQRYPKLSDEDIEIFLTAVYLGRQKGRRVSIITNDTDFFPAHTFYVEHMQTHPELYHPEVQIKLVNRELRQRRKRMKELIS